MAFNLGKRKRAPDSAPSPKRHHTRDTAQSGEEKDISGDDADSSPSSKGTNSGVEWARSNSPESPLPDPRINVAVHHLKPPTGEELRKIKDATDLYQSSSFKLQIDALLPNVRPKYHLSQSIDDFLLSLHRILMDLPSLSPQHPLHASRTLSQKGIAVPYIRPLPTEETKWQVGFEAPSEVMLAGSWATKTAVKAKDSTKFGVDVVVAMPSNLFQAKDYVNGRVFQKRAFYLSVIAAALADAKFPCDLFYESTSGDPRQTMLVLLPHESLENIGKLHARVRVIPFLPQSPISLQRLSPARSNIRASGQDDASKEEPTPLYNTALLQMNTPKPHLLSVHALKQDVPAFADALALLRIWANQRGYGLGGKLCVRGFEGKGMWWASILDMLVHGEEAQPVGLGKSGAKRKPLGKGLSSYQLFKASLDFLARHNFEEEPVFVKSKDGHKFPPASYTSHEAVFVDSTSSINLLANVPLSSLDMLKYDAQATLDVLDRLGISEDPFHAIFLQDHRDAFGRFDVVIQVDISSAEMRIPSAHLVADHGSVYNALMAVLASTLRRGLGNRAKAISVLHLSSGVRSLSQALPGGPAVILIGIILDTKHAFRLVDHGPTAEEQESEQAKQFREFWGEKAELRRFKDGSITESVVWDAKSADDRTYIPAMIVKHLLWRHFGVREDDTKTWQPQFDALVKAPESFRSLYERRGATGGFKAALTAFDVLVKQIKALDDQLPLAILNVSPVSPALRYTDVFIPITVPPSSRIGLPTAGSYLPAMEVIVEFEKSGRWPDDLRAVQKIKLAFLERLAATLVDAVKGLQATIVLGEHVDRLEMRDEAALDIVTPEGWAFRARIWHDREATLLDRVINDKSRHFAGEEVLERQAALEARDVYIRRFIHRPRLHRAIAALSHKFPAFSGTVRLTKRWFASHWLLYSHVSEEAVELLCAYVFLRTSADLSTDAITNPADVPGTKERGFAQVLRFLKDWDWTKSLVVPLDLGEQDTTFPDSGAPIASGVAWSLVTKFDPSGHIWTSSGPNGVVARRITAAAKAAWMNLSTFDSQAFSVKDLFEHPTEDYDFIVELDPHVLPRYHQNLNADSSAWTSTSKYANANPVSSASPIRPGFDPVATLLRDLRDVYEHTALLFYDPLGGSRVGGVWQPDLKGARSFRVLGNYSSLPVNKDGNKLKEREKSLVVLNQRALGVEIERIGHGLITGLSLSSCIDQ